MRGEGSEPGAQPPVGSPAVATRTAPAAPPSERSLVRARNRDLAPAGPERDEIDPAGGTERRRSDPSAASGDDRRAGERRAKLRVRERHTPRSGGGQARVRRSEEHFLPRHSRALALLLGLAYVPSTIVAGGLPHGGALAAGFASVILLAIGSVFARLERREGMPASARIALLMAGAVVPMGCAGYAIAHWVAEGLPHQWAIATLLSINAAAATVYRTRIVSLFSAQIASWAPFALVDPSPITFAAIIGGAIALLLIARFEYKDAQARRVRSEARERVAARAEDILRSFEETGEGWFWETDRRGQLTYISPKAAHVLGKRPDQVIGRPLTEIVHAAPRASDAERTLAFHLSARSAFHDIELRAATGDAAGGEGGGDERWWALTGRPVYDSYKNFCGFRGHGSDLTEKRRSEQQVSRLAHYDSLTGLANRVQMSRALEQILAAPRERDRACALFLLDLDRFKQVNDTLGHPAGDALLKQVAQRLERVIGPAGRCGRLGGDEFQVIIPAPQTREHLAHLAREIIATLSQPYTVDGHAVVIGASVGVAIAPEHGTTSEALIRNVDLALYAAKDAGRGCHRFYSDELHSAAEERAELEQDLRDAIGRGQLQLYYQPVVYAASETIVGFEALLRWNHPTRGWLSPAKFVPIAEDAGLIDQLGQWALRTACDDLARWPERVRCAVNVSPLQFANPELPNIVANALAHSGVDPSRLELEITESVFMGDSAATDAMFAALKRVGVRLALDDFGTGYSSLGYLRKAPFDKIKIDQSFVRGATEKGSRNGAIIASITSLAEALGMDTTAEGVETLDELELVRLLGCSHVQGYIYHKPLDALRAGALVEGDCSVIAEGPRSARQARTNLLRRVLVVHGDGVANATLRNISEGGVLLEGLWSLPAGTVVEIEFAAGRKATGTIRWTRENRTGVEFDAPLRRRSDGSFAVLRGHPARLAGSVSGMP
ncbi:PAS domain S-box-containing protein/diguanylate cyclase (GGDEF) domain-containing protein [Erythrobacter sp. HL-111]|nr:MAG: PAS domain S-box/diguanylate cyclase (GGDEF) domain [Erythrobacteraceae bacterium HL-111]SDS07047.1 PAS domain S-box-containing protein/diguanylate cyclase (GGDEF) domain-containing protein [Erythrobacter sp. HL-111]